MRYLAALLTLAFFELAFAQTTGLTRKVLARGDVSEHGHEAILVQVEIGVASSVGRHTHHGVEIGHIAEGDIEMVIEGEPPLKLKTGDAFVIPIGKVHDARNIGAGAARVIVTYVVEKDKPFATPAK